MILDAGDFAADPEPGNEFFTRGLLDGMRQLQYGATALGGRELGAGETLREALRAFEDFPILAANLRASERKKWGAVPHTVVEFPNYTVGIIGMVGTLKTDFTSEFSASVPEGAPRLLGYRRTLESQVKKLRDRCTVIILLAQADMGRATEILREFPEIDLLVSAEDAHLGREPIKVGTSVMVFAGKEGQRLGHLQLKVFDNGTVGVVWGQLIRLGDKIAEDPDARELVRRATAAANAWHRRRAEAALADGRSPLRKDSRFRTASACRECHAAAYEIWLGTAHARAMRVLEEGDQDYLPRCVSCHVTGWGEPDGFRDRLATPQLIDVQCEACHGPATTHIADPGRPYGPAGLEICADACHTPEQTAGAFEADREWEAIRH